MRWWPGFSRVGLTLAPHMLNGLGLPHGAVIFAMADYAFAAASNSYGESAVALSMDIHFLSSPLPGARLLAEAVEVSGGQRTALYRMTVADADSGLVAELHGMAYRQRSRFLEEPPQAAAQPGA